MTGAWIRAALAALALALAACSGGNEERPTQLQVFEASRAAIAQRRAQKAQVARPPLTRAALDTVDVSAIEVTLERRDIFAYLIIQTERRDDAPGTIMVWRSEDNATVATRNGVVIATRGLGGDILSSSVQVSGDAPGPSGGGERIMMIRALDNKEVALPMTCDLEDLGPEPVEIVELVHRTRHLRERCEGGGGAVVNDYWVDSHSGIVWQSRQWAGPYIGYMRLRRLTN